MFITIFLFSLSLIAVMIGFKTVELKIQRRLLFSELRVRADVLSFKIVNKVKKTISILNINNGKMFASFFLNLVFGAVSDTGRKIKLRKLKFIDSLRVNRNLKKKGSASFFLKNVSEYKGKYIK